MQGIKYTVDLVMCIDCTGSMGHVMELVKQHALKFHDDVRRECEAKGKFIDTMRARIIAFRDFYADGSDSLVVSDFFTLPDQSSEFSAFVSGLNPSGGGDLPESGLEALAIAIQSPWNTVGDRKRQVIVMFTDDAAHPLEKDAGSKPAVYPPDMPKNFSALTDLYDGQASPMLSSAKRLIIYAPDATPWTEIMSHWDNVAHLASQAGKGLEEHDYNQIVDMIVGSI
ncbi:MAG: VWA domain-containing protein [Armatimonadetes bacterium]|nr:VWA domain-containing protein [Armatimonadota bacterium]